MFSPGAQCILINVNRNNFWTIMGQCGLFVEGLQGALCLFIVRQTRLCNKELTFKVHNWTSHLKENALRNLLRSWWLMNPGSIVLHFDSIHRVTRSIFQGIALSTVISEIWVKRNFDAQLFQLHLNLISPLSHPWSRFRGKINNFVLGQCRANYLPALFELWLLFIERFIKN